MARVLKLENSDASLTADLLAGDLRMGAGSWSMAPSGERMVSRMQLVMSDVDADIITAELKVTELAEQARVFHKDKGQRISVWFYWKADAETAKRSLVYAIDLKPVVQGLVTPLLGIGHQIYDLVVEHAPFNEASSTSQAVSATLSNQGGKATITAQQGSLAGRVYRLYVRENTGALYRMWAGIRPTGPGVSSFDANWDLNSGTLGTDAANSGADAEALGGTAVAVSFATVATMATRVSMTVDQATATTDYDHFAGTYLVLLRYKLAATNVVRARMRAGFASSGYFAPRAIRKLANSSNYRLIELGEVSIPPYPFRGQVAAASTLRNFTIQVQAERISGSGTLYLDSVILVPTAHFVTAEGLAATGGTDRFEFHTTEDGLQFAFGINNSDEGDSNLVYGFRDWEVPLEGGVLVLAFEREDNCALNDNAVVVMDVARRHRVHAE